MIGSLIRSALLGGVLLASPALASPFSSPGYVLGCGEGGCTIFAQGLVLHVADDGTTPGRLIAQMDRMVPVTAVDLQGDLGDLAEASAEIRLTGLSLRPQDPYQDMLRLLQGSWTLAASDSPVEVQISGLVWQEVQYGEVARSALISPGSACADGSAPNGSEDPGALVLSLYPPGVAEAAVACWQVQEVSDTTLTLRDLDGAQGEMVFRRR